MCALRWENLNLDRNVVDLRRAISRADDGWVEKATKTHQHRRVVLDDETVAVLSEHRLRCEQRVVSLGVELARTAYVFSLKLDGCTFLVPDSVTQRYDRIAERLGIETTLHKLRHYSATELINAGVDLRTVAGRLGHGGGGATTLRVYAAWLSEADQRAAATRAAACQRALRQVERHPKPASQGRSYSMTLLVHMSRLPTISAVAYEVGS
jgi:integrase